jgi:hypothetical protein
VIHSSTYRQGLGARFLAFWGAVLTARLHRQRVAAWLSGLLALVLVWPLAASAATVATNGSATSGAILVVGQTNSYTFAATAGEAIQVRVGKTNGTLVPRVDIYNPSGTLITWGTSASVGTILNVIAPGTGTYTVVVSDFTNSGSTGNTGVGNYNLYVTRGTQASPESIVVPNGQATAGKIDIGDMDTYTFNATASETIQVRVGKVSGTLAPRVDIYSPSGNLITWGTSASVGTILNLTAPSTGTYTVVVSDFTDNGATGNSGVGTYNLYVTRGTQTSPEATVVPNGQATAGTIDLGDLDTYTFTATAGEALQVRVGKASGTLAPRVDIYSPSGNLITWGTSASVGTILNVIAPGTGTYTVVVSDFTDNGATGNSGVGDYNLYVTRGTQTNPEATVVPNGQATAGTIDIGDMDTYTFTATAGEAIQVRVGKTSGTLAPRVDIYSPSGNLITWGTSASVGAIINLTAPGTGTYTVVVSDFTNGGSTGNSGIGTYNLYVTRGAIAAASEASVLTAQSVAGQIDLGDLDSFKVAATAGQAFQITVSPTSTGWVPRIDLYSPAGGIVTYNSGASGATVSATPTATGNYTAVVSDYTNSGATGNSGTYTITATGAGDTAASSPAAGSDADTPLPFWVTWLFAGGLGMSVRRHLARKP